MAGGYWSPHHPVLEVLRSRRQRGDLAAERADPYRVGLAIQGGGMRGVITGAMLAALEDLGLHRAFDAVYGTSSGAMNAASFIGGGIWRPLQIYWNHLRTRRFVDARRFFTGDVLDLDYAFDTVLGELEPLDYDSVLDSKVPLHVALTLVDELRTDVVSGFESKQDLVDALRATTWLPVAVRGTATFRGKRAIDGSILTVHPYRMALADGCTHVLSLSSRPIDASSFELPLTRSFWRWRLDQLEPGLAEANALAMRDYRQDRPALLDWSRSPDQPPYVLDIALLPGMPSVTPYELRAERLITAGRWAHNVLTAAIEDEDPEVLRTAVRFTRTEGDSRL
ncbi:patatin-like phospholipase family protein [Microlunatus parietis]|nr:patatin-like phospholipase family protein [Microlunatus parietis]